MPASWDILHWPIPAFHVFLSHCAEDRESLVIPVFNQLQQAGVIPWFDIHHYPIAKDPFDALRDNLFRSRHIVYFVTAKYLRQGRGWCATERVYAEMIQNHFCLRNSVLWDFELPLIFVDRSAESLLRSTLNPIVAKALVCPFLARQRPRQIRWCVEQIKRLIQQQYASTLDLIRRLEGESGFVDELRRLPGLPERLISSDPVAPR